MLLPLDKAAVLKPNLRSLGTLGAWMIYPDDPAGRAAHLRLYNALHVLETVDKGATLASDAVAKALVMALHAPSPKHQAEAEAERYTCGHAAGVLLFNACARANRGETAVIGSLKELGSVMFRGKSQTSKYPNEVIWKRFRPVSNYWAAMVHLYGDEDREQLIAEFPCPPSDVAQFLAIADAFRLRAERTHIDYHGAILGPGVAYGLSEEVRAELPPGDLVFPVFRKRSEQTPH